MPPEKRTANRLIGLFLLGLLLFNYPLVTLFDRPLLVGGIPLLYLYLFGAWLLLIALMLLVSRLRPAPPMADTNG